MSTTLRDYAEVFHLAPTATSSEERLTIDRPDRRNGHNNTYDLTKVSPASRARIQRLLAEVPWYYQGMTPNGWRGYAYTAPEPEMRRSERLNMLDEARAHIEAAIQLIRLSTLETGQEPLAELSLIPRLTSCIRNHHSRASKNPANIECIRAVLK
ncbi:MAG TPA: hypothetical protein PKD09_10665 [Aggregatilinea sp.]|uniref:hypothetical protein n=1 Tax=Aggregatilinea sp. TaxID=2806333 RepID=UPI002BFA425C|nr:hypothetical protein [Aggregatilinea sp.]HML22105.1 hypothetical protein [Aggregatilinea sp.]